MLYVKCVLAGVGGLIVTSILYMYGYYFFAIRPTLPKMPPGEGVGIDIRVFFGPLFWVIALVAFATAFYWMFRRTAG
jgi:hypothetical protein